MLDKNSNLCGPTLDGKVIEHPRRGPCSKELCPARHISFYSFYEEYPGSVTDVSQFTFMVDKVVEYGYRKISFILDRGYFSKDNIRYIDKNDYTFIIMCKGCKNLVSSIVLSAKGTFEVKRESAIRSYKVYPVK